VKKLLLSVVLVFLFIPAVFASNWVFVAHSDNAKLLVDTESIQYDGSNIATCWARFDYDKPQYLPDNSTHFYSLKSHYRFNYHNRTAGTLSSIFYSEQSESGNIVSRNDNNHPEPLNIVPDSYGDRILKYVFEQYAGRPKR